MATGPAPLPLLQALKDNSLSDEEANAVRLKACKLAQLPEGIPELGRRISLLDLADNELTTLPESFAKLEKLKVLFFLKNRFEVAPDVLGRLPSLYMLSFKSNQLTVFPDAALAPTVGWLILTDNKLAALPSNVGNVPLRKAAFAANRLTSLPESLSTCTTLELLRISANELQTLPAGLFSLPKLAWLGVAGNPCSYTNRVAEEAMDALPRVPWSNLRIDDGEPLGSGASGVVRAATMHDGTRVAVKRYHAQATSDGRPEDEVKAAVTASGHDNVMRTLFALDSATDTDAGALALGLPLLDMARYSVLGNVPSFDSVSRDTYPDGRTFASGKARDWAIAVSRALAHLHRKGICHGDAYAHNTLIDDVGDLPAMLSDFGAAWFYPPDSVQAPLIERMEARALGCLLEELAERLEGDGSAETRSVLMHAATHCMDPTVASRPSMSEVVEYLASGRDFAT